MEVPGSEVARVFNSHDLCSEHGSASVTSFLACRLHLMTDDSPDHPRVIASTGVHPCMSLSSYRLTLYPFFDLERGKNISGWGTLNETWGTEKWKAFEFSELHGKTETFCGFFNNRS